MAANATLARTNAPIAVELTRLAMAGRRSVFLCAARQKFAHAGIRGMGQHLVGIAGGNLGA
jgi:hypothetical protein